MATSPSRDHHTRPTHALTTNRTVAFHWELHIAVVVLVIFASVITLADPYI